MSTSTDLYREVRGHGPAVLFIPGAGGDASAFTRTAELLSDQFTVITYDRRGNSRSRHGDEGPDAATIAAQADDAAALIRECGLEQAVVFGTSGGAIITLELLARHPGLVRGAIVHEPPLLAVLPHDDGPTPLQPVFDLARTDPEAAMEAFIRLNAGDTAWESIDPQSQQRVRSNGEFLLHREVMHFLAYQPDGAALRACGVPIELLHSAAGLPFAPAVNAWLQANVGLDSSAISGHHAPYLDTADVFAEEIRPLLQVLAKSC